MERREAYLIGIPAYHFGCKFIKMLIKIKNSSL
jgi:hypothetical protein